MGAQGRQRGEWKVENGYFEVVPKAGYIYTREAFGDCQLHVEFAEPFPAKGENQDRGNSGVFCRDSTRLKSWTLTKARPMRTARLARSMANTLHW